MSNVLTPGKPPDRGERESFPAFYGYWMPRLLRYLRNQTSDHRWVEDVAQEAMLAARAKWNDLITYDKPGAWLFKVATTMLRRWQSKAREQCTSLDDMITNAGDGIGDRREAVIDAHIDLMAAIRALPRRQREVITLHCVIEFSLPEVADILGITESSAKTHLRRARAALTEAPRPVTVRGRV